MKADSREAWQRVYAKHGLQYGGRGDIRPLEARLLQGALVLDAGCGDGKTTEVLARRYETVGCDFSREALISLRSQRPLQDSVNLVECNLLSLPFVAKKFDGVSCVHALSHMRSSDRVTTARELARVLKPGGHILIEAFGRSDIRFGDGEEVEESSFLRGNGILTHYFTEGEIAGLFPGLELLSEISDARRVALGAVAGKREVVRVLMRMRP